MRPSASSAARISRAVRKIRTPPPKRWPPPANSSIRKPRTTRSHRRHPRKPRRNFSAASLRTSSGPAIQDGPLSISIAIGANAVAARFPEQLKPGRWRDTRSKFYWEIGGAGGPAGAIGGNGGAEAAVTATGGEDTAGAAAGSEPPLTETADTAGGVVAGGAGVTGGTGSDRSVEVSPPLSTLADWD